MTVIERKAPLMLTLGGIIGLYIAALIVGKHCRRLNAGTIVLLTLFAIIQTALVVFDMFSRHMPSQ